MPYIVITRRNMARKYSRHAVVALDELRDRIATGVFNDNDDRRDVLGQFDELPEYGGTITFPSGTEIEVQPRDAVHMARDAGVEAPGLTDEQICAAWNETH